MNHSTANILDLPDEILLKIFKKLNNTDVLYLISGIHEKLDSVIHDPVFTQSIDLSTANTIFSRFCSDILPKIHHKVECLTLQGSSLDDVLHAGNYPSLSKLTLLNFNLDLASLVFSGM